jgi:hypothetical protein
MENLMITGSHTIIYTKDAAADRRFLKDVLKLPSVDAGGGWLIFGLPPSEVAFHPHDKNDEHEFYLICDDVEALIGTLKKGGLRCGPIKDEGWGLLTEVTLPGGGSIGIYEPRHARPTATSGKPQSKKLSNAKSTKSAKKAKTKPTKKRIKKAAKKKASRR